MSKEYYVIQGVYGKRGAGKSYHEMQKELKRKNNEIERLQNDLDRANSKIKEYGTRLLKAIELLQKYNDNESNYYVPVYICLDTLLGEDND